MTTPTHDAVLWEPLEDQMVHCFLCHFDCRIAPGRLGHCQVRANHDGKLVSLNYHAVCAAHIDPIEKKPLFHFQPGSRSFSIAAPGCNFRCDFCQNWQISQLPRLEKSIRGDDCDPADIVAAAQRSRCASISYTYTEPTIFMELAADCGRRARQLGLANVFVSNGYMTPRALDFARDFLDAVNVDLKAFTEDFYHNVCKAALSPVLDTLRYLAHHSDIWLEVTTLVVPGLNDSDRELSDIAQFIAHDLGPHVPWHVSRFYPNYERDHAAATPPDTLSRAYELGRQAGLHYIYIGNLPGRGGENTLCHHCGQILIQRTGFQITARNLTPAAACPHCQTPLAGKSLAPA